MTGNVLKENEISVGTFFLGYGITDNWTIGTSPFVLASYSMYNLGSRYAVDLTPTDRVVFAFEYFKTFGAESDVDRRSRENCQLGVDYGLVDYINECARTLYPKGFSSFKMEAVAYKLNFSRQIDSDYKLNVTGSYYYYMDDEKPFSLRMDPLNNDKFAINLTTLHEFRLNKKAYFNLEAGLWGMNYTHPYYHLGTSFSLQLTSASLVSAGVSSTWSPSFPKEKARVYSGYDSTRSIHPEIQVQYYF